MSESFSAIQPRIDPAGLVGKTVSGVCPVCGREAVFSGFTENERESGFCSECGSFNRQRQMAIQIRSVIGCPLRGPLSFPDGFAIYNTESNGALHRQLSTCTRYVCSEYFGHDVDGGALVDGVMHQDLQHLSFAKDQFNLVLSSDVFEHMPRPYDAHREVFRILKSGGRHIFTVPFSPADHLDDVRAEMIDGEIVYHGEKMFHGDPVRPDNGVLVWTIFGRQMLDELRVIGFRTTFDNIYYPNSGIFGPFSIVFDASKP